MSKFESFRKAIPFGKKGEKVPPAPDASRNEAYLITEKNREDSKLAGLLQARKEIEFYQETGSGTRDDERRVEELDKQIADRLEELSQAE